MPKIQPFTNEQDVEEEAIDLIASLGYTDLRSAEYNRPNIQVDSERDNDHQKIVLEPRLMAALKQINPGLRLWSPCFIVNWFVTMKSLTVILLKSIAFTE